MQLVRAPFQQGACARKAPVRASVVRCNVSFKPEQAMAAVLAAGVLLTPPALALENPQGSNSAAVEAQLEALIEARTGKAAALPILDEVPQAPAPKKAAAVVEAPVVPAVPMAPAVVEPPLPAPVAAPTPAPAPAPARPTGLQVRETAQPAAPAGNNGLIIGGGVAVLGVAAAAAMAGNSGQTVEQAAAASAAPPAAAAAAPPADAAAAPAEAAAEGDGASA